MAVRKHILQVVVDVYSQVLVSSNTMLVEVWTSRRSNWYCIQQYWKDMQMHECPVCLVNTMLGVIAVSLCLAFINPHTRKGSAY